MQVGFGRQRGAPQMRWRRVGCWRWFWKARTEPRRCYRRGWTGRHWGEPGRKTARGTVFPANARVGQQGSLTCVWAERGSSRPRAPHDQRYTSACLFGAVCPARGVGAALVLPGVNIAAMNPAPGRDQLPGSSRRPCRHHARHHARRRGLVSTGRRRRRARHHQPLALAAVFARAEPA